MRIARTSTCCSLLTLFLVVATLVGCEEEPIPTGNFSGKILSNGKVLADCNIGMRHQESMRTLGAEVDSAGSFSMTEIPLGIYDISVSQRPTGEPGDPPFDKRIPRKYRTGKTSGLSVDIKEGENSRDIKMTY